VTTELAFGVGLLALIGVAAWAIHRTGKTSERAKVRKDILDAIDKANEARNRPDARDPRDELRDDWR
jgi:hypothetical protein